MRAAAVSDANRLLGEARAGDAAVLGRLLDSSRHYLGLLARVEIGKRLQGKLDASDVVQEAFLDAHRFFPNFRGQTESQLILWLPDQLRRLRQIALQSRGPMA